MCLEEKKAVAINIVSILRAEAPSKFNHMSTKRVSPLKWFCGGRMNLTQPGDQATSVLPSKLLPDPKVSFMASFTERKREYGQVC